MIAAALLLVCSGWVEPASAQSETRAAGAPSRVYGVEIETDARTGADRVLIFAEKELERSVDAPRNGVLRIRLAGSVLADSTPRSIAPTIEGAIRAVHAKESTLDGVQVVEVRIEHAEGLQARVSHQGSIVAVEFPLFVRPDARGFALHFDNEPLATVVRELGAETGESFVFDDRLRGTVTITAPDRVSPSEALALLDAALFLRGFAAVRGPGDFRKIVPLDQIPAIAPWNPDAPEADREAPITTLVRLQRAALDDVIRALAPAVGTTGLAVPLYDSRSVILAGNESQLHRWIVLAQALDRADIDEIRILRLSNRPASEVAPLLQDLTRDSEVSADEVSIWADERSNALIVRARPERFEDIRYWVNALDTMEAGRGEIRVIHLQNADPEEVAGHLQELSGAPGTGGSRDSSDLEGLVVVPHVATSSLVVRGSAEGHALVRNVVRDLDLRPPQVAVEVTVVEIRVGEERALGLNYVVGIGDPESNPDDVFGVISRVPTGGFPDIVETPELDPSFAARVRGKEIGIPVFGPGGETTVFTPLYQVLVTADAGEVESRILMRPHFIATNGEEQEFFVGDIIPIAQATSGEGATDPLQIRTDIEREDVGLHLRVKPSIGQAGGVGLDLQLDFTALSAIGDESHEVVLIQRRLSANANLRDGEYAVIGFTSREREFEASDQRLPFLDDIPLIRWLFGSERSQSVQTYFLVMAKATIQRSPEDQVAYSMRARLAMERSMARVGDLREGTGVRYAVLMATRGQANQATAIAQSLPLAAGEEVKVSGWTWEDRTRFDVVVTGYRDLAGAGQAATRLRETGYHPQVIAVPGPEQAPRP